MTKSHEQLTDEMISHLKKGGQISDWSEDHYPTALIDLMITLNSVPLKKTPDANFLRIKNQVLDKISLPNEIETETSKLGYLTSFIRLAPRFLKIGAGAMASILVVLSLTIGTAVAAMQSVPGQSIYPLKIIVENVQLKLASSEEEKTNLQIKFANTRLDELEVVLEKGKQGKISEEEVQKVVVNTVKDVQKTNDVVNNQNKASSSKVTTLTKMVTLSNKQTALLQAAKIESEGEVKIELEKAIVASKVSQEQAMENIERAGLKIETPPISMEEKVVDENKVSASGKLTAVANTSVNIGSARFLLTEQTKYVNIKLGELKVDQIVNIIGEIKEGKTYAIEIKLEETQSEQTPGTVTPETPATQENP